MMTKTKTALPTVLLGAFCCLYFALKGTASHCLTSGCSIYAGFSFLGITFYMWGFLFFLVALLAVFYKKSPVLYASLITAALLGDAAFLGYQLLFWPCLNCLTVAAIVGALTFTVRFDNITNITRRCMRGAFWVWSLLFFAVSVNAAKEIVMSPWSLTAPSTETAQVYFSPTCPSCKDTVGKILSSADANNVRFIPVAKNNIDSERLAALPANPSLAEIGALFDDDAATASVSWIDTFHNFTNKSAMASLGMTTVPAIVSSKVFESPSFFAMPSVTPVIKKPAGSCSIVFEDPECKFPNN
jgi:hypothetical protein